MLRNQNFKIVHKIIGGLWEYRLYVFFFVMMLCFTSITGFNGLYGQDSYEYLRFTNALAGFAKNGINPGIDYWPVLYPLCGMLFSAVFKLLFALQLVSVLSLILSGIYFEKILKALYKEEARSIRFFVFLFFLFSPYLLRASFTVMSDSLCLFFVTAACYYFIKYKEEKNNLFFIGFITLATSAISTRYGAFVVLIIPGICVAYSFFRNFRLMPFLVAVAAALLILLPYILIHKSSSTNFFQHEWLQGWSFKNFFRSDFSTADGNAVYTFPNILYCFFNLVHPAYCFAGILFIIFSFKALIKKGTSATQWVFIASLLLYAFFLAGIPFQNLRFLILSFPFVLVLFFPGFMEIYTLLKKAKPRFLTPLLLLSTVLQGALFVRVFIPFYHDNKIERQISNEVMKYDTATLYTFSIEDAVRYYGFKNKIINMWKVKLDTLPPIRESALVLFNEKQFSDEWKNKNPMLNWEYLNTKYQLIKLRDLPDNWGLYYIVGKGFTAKEKGRNTP
ncbi:MAG TPA: hypothetical protein VK809_00280 [Bacteroidia bacterium]|jgi:hypothetical protein|nr:hypothetical protein [Bacteroidia bacterium]